MRAGCVAWLALLVFASLRCASAHGASRGSPVDEPIAWDMPSLTLEDALRHFSNTTGFQVTANLSRRAAALSPIKGRYTPRQVFAMLLMQSRSEGSIMPSGRTYRVWPKVIQGLNDKKRHYRLPRRRLPDLLNLLSKASEGMYISYVGNRDAVEAAIMVGPIEGTLTLQEAIERILGDIPTLTYRWLDEQMLVVESRANVPPEEDLLARAAANELCRVRVPPKSDRMLVVARRLPSVASYNDPVVILDRRSIDNSGADSIPELLRAACAPLASQSDLFFEAAVPV